MVIHTVHRLNNGYSLLHTRQIWLHALCIDARSSTKSHSRPPGFLQMTHNWHIVSHHARNSERCQWGNGTMSQFGDKKSIPAYGSRGGPPSQSYWVLMSTVLNLHQAREPCIVVPDSHWFIFLHSGQRIVSTCVNPTDRGAPFDQRMVTNDGAVFLGQVLRDLTSRLKWCFFLKGDHSNIGQIFRFVNYHMFFANLCLISNHVEALIETAAFCGHFFQGIECNCPC